MSLATDTIDKICEVCIKVVWENVDNGRPHVELAKTILKIIQEYDDVVGR